MLSVMLRLLVIVKCLGVVLAASVGFNDVTKSSDATWIGSSEYLKTSDSGFVLPIITTSTEATSIHSVKTDNLKNTQGLLYDQRFEENKKKLPDIISLRRSTDDKSFSEDETELNIPVAIVFEQNTSDVSHYPIELKEIHQEKINSSLVLPSQDALFSSTEKEISLEVETYLQSRYVSSRPTEGRAKSYEITDPYVTQKQPLIRTGNKSESTITDNESSYKVSVNGDLKSKIYEQKEKYGQQKSDFVTTFNPHWKGRRGHIKYGDTVKLSYNEITDDRHEIPFVENLFRSRNFTRDNDTVQRSDQKSTKINYTKRTEKKPEKQTQSSNMFSDQFLYTPATKIYNPTKLPGNKLRIQTTPSSYGVTSNYAATSTPYPETKRRGNRKYAQRNRINTRPTVNDYTNLAESLKTDHSNNSVASKFKASTETQTKFEPTPDYGQPIIEISQPSIKHIDVNVVANATEALNNLTLNIGPSGQSERTDINFTGVNTSLPTLNDKLHTNSFQHQLQDNKTNSMAEISITQRPLRIYSGNLAGFLRLDSNLDFSSNINNKKYNNKLTKFKVQQNFENSSINSMDTIDNKKYLALTLNDKVQTQDQAEIKKDKNDVINDDDTLSGHLNDYYNEGPIHSTTEYNDEIIEYDSTTKIILNPIIPDTYKEESDVINHNKTHDEITSQLHQTNGRISENINKSNTIEKEDRTTNNTFEIKEQDEVINKMLIPKIVRVYGKRINKRPTDINAQANDHEHRNEELNFTVADITYSNMDEHKQVTTSVITESMNSKENEHLNIPVEVFKINNKIMTDSIISEKVPYDLNEVSTKALPIAMVSNATESSDEITTNDSNKLLTLKTKFTNSQIQTTTSFYDKPSTELYQINESILELSPDIDDMQYSNNLFKPLLTVPNYNDDIEPENYNSSIQQNNVIEMTKQVQYAQVTATESDLNVFTNNYGEYDSLSKTEGTVSQNTNNNSKAYNTGYFTKNIKVTFATSFNESDLSNTQHLGMSNTNYGQYVYTENTNQYDYNLNDNESTTEQQIETSSVSPSDELLEQLSTTIIPKNYASDSTGYEFTITDDEVSSSVDGTSEYPSSTKIITDDLDTTSKTESPKFEIKKNEGSKIKWSSKISFSQNKNNTQELPLNMLPPDMHTNNAFNSTIDQINDYIRNETQSLDISTSLPQRPRTEYVLNDYTETTNVPVNTFSPIGNTFSETESTISQTRDNIGISVHEDTTEFGELTSITNTWPYTLGNEYISTVSKAEILEPLNVHVNVLLPTGIKMDATTEQNNAIYVIDTTYKSQDNTQPITTFSQTPRSDESVVSNEVKAFVATNPYPIIHLVNENNTTKQIHFKTEENISTTPQISINESNLIYLVSTEIENNNIKNISLSLLPPIGNKMSSTGSVKFDGTLSSLNLNKQENYKQDPTENVNDQEEPKKIHVLIISGNDSEEVATNDETSMSKVSKETVDSNDKDEPKFKSESKNRGPVVLIINSDFKVYSQNGRFVYSYDSTNGSKGFIDDELKIIDEAHTTEAVPEGFSLDEKEGRNYAIESIEYAADENGYRPVKAHLAASSTIPPAIARALAYLATESTQTLTVEKLDIK